MHDSDYWDGVAPRYASLYSTAWSRFEDELTRADLLALARGASGERILDVGCGYGLAYELLCCGANGGSRYMGTDISQGMLDQLASRHPAVGRARVSGDELADHFAPASFDMLVAINVAASFPRDTERLLRSVRILLAPGGRFYLSFLNRFSLRRLLRVRLRSTERYRTRGDHRSGAGVIAHAYSGPDLLRLCMAHGLQSTTVSYQSVLGGVYESRHSIPVERCLARLMPRLGHAVIATGGSPSGI